MYLQIGASTAGSAALVATAVLGIFTVVVAWTTREFTRHSRAHTRALDRSRQAIERQTAELERGRKVAERRVEELQTSRRAEFKPVLVASTSPNFVGTVNVLTVENVGRGPARNVTVEWGVGDERRRNWETRVFRPNERHGFDLPFECEAAAVGGPKEERPLLEVAIVCEDALGNRYEFEDEIDVEERLRERRTAGELRTEDLSATFEV